MRHAADGAGELHPLVVHAVGLRACFDAIVGNLAFQIAGGDAEGGNLLAEIVMQLDDPAVALFANRVLRNAGFEVLVAGNGRVALATVETEQPDLVIADLVMPEREGLETIVTLRKRHRSLPIIAISGAFGGHFLKSAATLGAHATLPKPFSAEELLEAVRAVLDAK
jgi:DNA-binding response OmpR family regulator